MISFAKEEDIGEIILLWNEAFGDSREDIEYFLSLYKDYVLVFKEEKVKGMLVMLPVYKDGEKGRYIYAVTTNKKERGQGISTKLLEAAKEYIKNEGENFLVLVPSEDSLFEFYEKRGFEKNYRVCKGEYNSDDKEFISETEKISCKDYYTQRKKYFKDREFIEWHINELEYISHIYKGNILRVNDSFMVCSFYDGILDIKELLLGNDDIGDIISAVCKYFGVRDCIAALPLENEKPYAMVYPKEYKNCYFNLAMD